MAHTTPTGGTSGVPTNVHLNITAAPKPPKQYIWYGGERYLVQAFQKGAGAGGTDLDITDHRDWTEAGFAAMKAADKVFQRNSVNIAEVKTVQVPLTGEVSIEEGKATQAANIKIGSNIQYAKTVTNKPTTPITLKPEDLQSIQDEITEIGQATATWKDPTFSHQRSQQQGAATSQRTDTPPPQATPTDSTASNPSATPEIQLPDLPALPTATPASQNALLSTFLKSQVSPGSTDPIQATCRNTSAAASLAEQINQIRPGSPPVTADSLQKGAAKHIVDNPSSYRSDSDIADMLQVLKKSYDSVSRDATLLRAVVRQGAKEIKESDYATLPSILDRAETGTLIDSEKTLVATAYANYLHNTPATPDTNASANVFFKAALAFVNAPPSGISGIGAFISREPPQRPIHLVIATEKDGNYETHFRDPASGRLDSNQTAFILFNENPLTPIGKYSAFNRVAMTTRDPFTELPRQLASSATRPAYYPAGILNIETGGGGNCAASALADAVMQKDSKYYSSSADWHTQLESDKTQIRQRAMGYMYDHPEDFLVKVNDINMFDQVKSGITDSLVDIRSAYPAQAQTLNALIRKPNCTVEEKKWLIKLYAHYSSQKNNDLDTPFFMAYAKATNTKIALIDRDTNKIFFVTPMPDKAIDASEYLFVRFETGHYQSINRETNTPAHTPSAPGSAFLDQIVARYNDSHASTIAIRGFLGSISDTDTLQENLSNLKLKAPAAYLALQELVDPDLLKGVLERNEIDPFIAALTQAARPTGDTPEALATAVDTVFTRRSDLQARANFLTKLIEARTSRPGSDDVNSAIQNDLRAALTRMKNEDTAGYMYFRTQLVGNKGEVPDDLNLTQLFDMDLNIATNLDRTDSGTITDADLRQKEIAKRKASMVAEAGGTVAGYYKEAGHSAESARAEFFTALMKVSTSSSTLSESTIGDLERHVSQLALLDPNGYFAYRSYLASHPESNSWKALVDNRDRAMTEIFTLIAAPRIEAQANVIKAVQTEEAVQLRQAVEQLEPQEHFALEYTIGKGELTAEQMATELTAFIHSKDISTLTSGFADWIHSPATKELFDRFIPALELHRGLLERNPDANPHEYNGAYSGTSIPATPGLKGANFPAYLAIEDMYLRAEDHREVLHASYYAAKHKTTAEVKKAIADSAVAMNSRAKFLNILKRVKAPSAAIGATAIAQEKSKKIQDLGNAIADMQKNDIQGFLGLVQITKKTDPTAIAQFLFEDGRDYNHLEHLFVPYVEGFVGQEENRRAVYAPTLDQTIYSPALIARANLIQAAMKQPHAITKELWDAVKANDPVGALALGQLIYAIDKDTPHKIPAETDVSTQPLQIAYGKAKIEEDTARIAQIRANKWNDFLQLLATKQANEAADDLENIPT